MILFRTNSLKAFEVAFLSDMASDHLVKFSMAANIQIFPLEGGDIGPIRFIDHV